MEPTMKQIKVRCARGVALEMCRYDGSKIVFANLVDSRFDAVVDRMRLRNPSLTDEEVEREKEQHRLYDFVIEGQFHTIARWKSFGVRPEFL